MEAKRTCHSWIILVYVSILTLLMVVTSNTECHVKLAPNDGVNYGYFGRSVAISNNVAIVGAERDIASGSVYVFERNTITGSWNQTDKLRANDSEVNDNFGNSVAITDNCMIIGAYNADSTAGCVYVFEKDTITGSWNQTSVLRANDGASYDYFGYSVAISNNSVIIGASGDGAFKGSAYIFERNRFTGIWNDTPSYKFTASDGADYDEFGKSVAISQNIVIVGAPGHEEGSAYIFEKDETTGNWNQTKVTLNITGKMTFFGYSVAISNNTVIIGAYSDENEKGTGAGSVYVFKKDIVTGNWNQTDKLTANDGTSYDYFGRSVAISNNIVIIGADGDDVQGTVSGSAYIFEKDAITGDWNQTDKLVPYDGTGYDLFGDSVAISENSIIVGAYGDETYMGTAYIFNLKDRGNINLIFGFGNDNHNDNDELESMLPNDVLIESYCSSDEIGDSVSVDMCNYNTYQSYDDYIVLKLKETACIQIGVSDCDNADLTNSNYFKENQHRYYTIYVNNATSMIGDYYDSVNSHTICTYENHISFCVYSSQYCLNNKNIITVDYDDIVAVKSYQSMVNCSFWLDYSQNMVKLECSASYSCLNNNLTFDKDVIIDCGSTFACAESYFDNSNDENSFESYVNCYGFGSCNSITIGAINAYLFGLQSVSNLTLQLMHSNDNNASNNTISLSTASSFVVMNTNIYISSAHTQIHISNDSFSFYNVTLSCDPNTVVNCNISCERDKNNNTNTQFLILDDVCNNKCTIDYECNILDNIDSVLNSIDNITFLLINDITWLSDQFKNDYKSACDLNTRDNNSLVFDIGFAFHSDEDISNDNQYGTICCRGYESCAHTNTITTDLASILCLGNSACSQSKLIYTGDYTDGADTDNYNYDFYDNVNNTIVIYCMGYDSCYESTLRSRNNILCGAYRSCLNALLMNTEKVYCSVKYSCVDSIMLSITEIYIINQQSGINAFSGDKSETYIYLIGNNAGDDITYNCEQDSICYINCAGIGSCNNLTTVLKCEGKCFVTCNGIFDNSQCVNMVISLEPTSSPTAGPTNAPSLPPSAAPTSTPTLIESNALTEQDVSIWFNWMLISIVIAIVLITVIGYNDAKKYRKNDLFQWNSLVIFGFYTIDFLSDVFFSMKLYLVMGDQNFDLIHVILFSFSILFVILPLFANIFTLHSQLSKWMIDPILKHTDTRQWILSHTKLIYLFVFISGSAFSVIALFNTYLFQLSLFSMGLSRYHQRKFANKRLFYVVLIENFPQLLIQIVSLILSIKNNDDYSLYLITLFSMLFTFISILLSVFEYFFSKNFIQLQSSIIVTFNVESKDISSMQNRQFIKEIVFRKNKLVHYMAQLFNLTNNRQGERLKPKKDKNGVICTFAIDVDKSKLNNVQSILIDVIDSNELAKVKDTI